MNKPLGPKTAAAIEHFRRLEAVRDDLVHHVVAAAEKRHARTRAANEFGYDSEEWLAADTVWKEALASKGYQAANRVETDLLQARRAILAAVLAEH